MSACPACGVEHAAGKKFCRACGSSLPEATAPPGRTQSASTTYCSACGKPSPAGATFCRSCGGALGSGTKPAAAALVATRSDPVTSPGASTLPLAGEPNTFEAPRVVVSDPAPMSTTDLAGANRRRAWIVVGAVAAAVLFGAGGFYSLKFRGPTVAVPDEAVLRSHFAGTLPAHINLTSLRAQTPENVGTKSDPAFKTRFHAAVVIVADTFTQSSAVDGAVILTPAVVKGTVRELDGTAVSRLSQGNWRSDFSVDHDPIPGFGRPRGLFPGSTVVRGSADETGFSEDRRRSEADRGAAATFEPEAVRAAPPEDRRREADPVGVEAAQVERRAPAVREVDVRKAEVDAQQTRDAVPRELEKNKAEADAQHRRDEEAWVAAAETGRGQQVEEVAAQTVEVPAGTEINVRLTTKLSSGSVHVEDRFEVTVQEDVKIQGRTVVPSGSVMRGIVSSVEPATRTNRTARMTLAFDQITIDGQTYPIRARVTEAIVGAGLKGEATKIAVGAGLGGVLGGLLGGGKGAVAGTLMGGGGSIAATEGKQVELAQGTVLRTRIDAPVQIHIK